ncbi:MAG: DUF1080 domain-containing protein [Rhodothermales bacterium]
MTHHLAPAMLYRLSLVLLAVALIGCTPESTDSQESEADFVDLISDDMSGWINPYDWGTYSVDDGVVSLVGDTKWFLVTEETYGDFVFEADVMVPDSGNSGFMFRAHYEPNRVWGYQAEVDPSDRQWSGGLYDEARRGWINPLDGEEEAEARSAFNNGEWNHYRIEADGSHLQIWVNGVRTTDYYDTMDIEGHLALQHHGEDGLVYRFRNVRVRDLGRHAWRPIFNGRDFDGWRTTPGGEWTVEDGILVGTQEPSDERHGLLLTEVAYDDFSARLDFQAREGNSGFYFRAEEVEDDVHVHGFQAEIEPDGETGGLYETGGRGWVVEPETDQVEEWLNDPGEWNELSVVAQGPRILVHVNGHESADIVDEESRRSGPLGLQLHGGMTMDVRFKDIEVLKKVE